MAEDQSMCKRSELEPEAGAGKIQPETVVQWGK